MNSAPSRWISLFLLAPLGSFAAADSTFHVEEEIDVHYKRQVPLYIQHDLGDVTIQGWNQDLIRVKVKKTKSADSEENAKKAFQKLALIALETPKAVELRVGTPQGTDLLSKLRQQKQKKETRVDLEIKAPASLPLSIVLGPELKLKLSQWRGKLDLSGKNNTVEMSKLRMDAPVNVSCSHCGLQVSESQFSGSILGGDQKIEIRTSHAASGAILVFSEKGDVILGKNEGEIQVRTQSGNVRIEGHTGSLQAQTQSGKISGDGFSGDLDLQTKTGEIEMKASKVGRQWKIGNREGKIRLELPRDFQGELNLQSIKGEVTTDFPVQKNRKKMEKLYGPDLKGRLFGLVGSDESVNVSVSSETGSIDVQRRDRAP